jgi:hypothetical protein
MIFSERRSHVPGSKRRIDSYRQPAVLAATSALQVPKGSLCVLEDPACELDEFEPRDGEMSPSACPLK